MSNNHAKLIVISNTLFQFFFFEFLIERIISSANNGSYISSFQILDLLFILPALQYWPALSEGQCCAKTHRHSVLFVTLKGE